MTNSRFEDLQKRCLKLKIKFFLKVIVSLSLLIFISSFSVTYFFNSTEKEYQKVEAPKYNIVEKPIKKETLSHQYEKVEVPKTPEKKVEHTVFVEDKEEESKIEKEIKYNTLFLQPHITFPPKSQKTEQIIEKQEEKETIVKTQSSTVSVKPVISVKNIDYANKLLLEFQKSEEYEPALNLAKHFFGKEMFEKAVYWAKIASRKQPFQDRPWILFAQSKVRLGKVNEAINSLELYLQYYSSADVQVLLEKIKKEKNETILIFYFLSKFSLGLFIRRYSSRL